MYKLRKGLYGFTWQQDNTTWWPQNTFFRTNKDVSEWVGSSRLTACLAHPTTSKGEAMSIFKNVTRIWEPGVVLIWYEQLLSGTGSPPRLKGRWWDITRGYWGCVTRYWSIAVLGHYEERAPGTRNRMEGDRLSTKMQDTAIWTLKNKTNFQIVSKDMKSPDSRVQKDKSTN